MRSKPSNASEWGARLIAGAFWLSGWVPVYFAGRINFQAAASQGEAWAGFAIVSTILTAILVETAVLSFLRRMYVVSALAFLVVVPFFSINMLAASGNVAALDTHAREARAAAEMQQKTARDRRADAVIRRDYAKAAAAGETEQTAHAKIDRLITEQPRAWDWSNHCDPAHIASAGTAAKDICPKIADLKTKAAAAKAYEEARKIVDDIDAKTWNTGTIAASTGAGAGADVKLFAARIGFDLSPEDGEKAFESGRGGTLELAGAIGPGVMTLFAWLLLRSQAPAPVRQPMPKRLALPSPSGGTRRLLSFRRSEPEPVVAYPMGSAREFFRRHLELTANPEDKIPAGDVQKRYAADCDRHHVEALKVVAFSKALQDIVTYGKTRGGRPYYYGVKWRDVPLPVVRSNGPHIVVDNAARMATA